MDAIVRPTDPDPVIVVTGAGSVVLPPGTPTCDPLPFLKTRKSRKYMGVQDDLAVVSAGRALTSAGLAGAALGECTGLYLAVGYIPFQEQDIRPVLAASLEEGEFSMARFAGGGYQKAHPLLTFRCLPNMPAYHVSVSFDIQGPYLVTYPGAGQFYLALEEACAALRAGRVDIALVGGVGNQRNFLVEHHFRRILPSVPAEQLRDAGGVLVLERQSGAESRGASTLATLESLAVSYTPFDALEEMPAHQESMTIDGISSAPDEAEEGVEIGPASLPAALSSFLDDRRGAALFSHVLHSRDGIRGSSRWSF
jgi:3-oxoacyl-(acyl-carrier-protein) synthase